MRQCVFVIGNPAELAEFAPLLRRAADARLRHSIWYTPPQDATFDALRGELSLSSRFAQHDAASSRWLGAYPRLRALTSYYQCFRYVGGVRLWTGKSPLVVVQGCGLSTWLAGVMARWGGGQVVHFNAANGKAPPTSMMGSLLCRRIAKKARYALCPGNEATRREQRYPSCIVVDTGDEQRQMPLAVTALLRWTGGQASP
ncbi:MAG: hypothetical protein HKN64_07470 [Woeseiaceae bacterium]|nr:hypothetical protein [Woeseiaceae bacterium]